MKKLMSTLLVATLALSVGTAAYAAENTGTEKQIVYQDANYTVVATPIMSKEEADVYFQHLVDMRGVRGDANLKQREEHNISPFATSKTYSKSKEFDFSGLDAAVTLVFSATTKNTTSTDIGTLKSARVNANSEVGIKNRITYQSYDKELLDGGRTYALNFSFDIEQESQGVGGTYTQNDSGAAIFEIYSTGGCFVY